MVANECAIGSDKGERDNVEADRHVGYLGMLEVFPLV